MGVRAVALKEVLRPNVTEWFTLHAILFSEDETIHYSYQENF